MKVQLLVALIGVAGLSVACGSTPSAAPTSTKASATVAPSATPTPTPSPSASWKSCATYQTEIDAAAATNPDYAKLLTRLATIQGCQTESVVGSDAATPSASPIELAVSFTCTDDETMDEFEYATMDEVWKAIDDGAYFMGCDVNLENPEAFVPTAAEKKVLKPLNNFTDYKGWAGKYASALTACVDETFADEEPGGKDMRAMMVVCPKHPRANVVAALAEGRYIPDDGDYDVGDIQPGQWRTTNGVDDCYWERTSRGGNILANNFITHSSGKVSVYISGSDGSFSTQGCGSWKRVG